MFSKNVVRLSVALLVASFVAAPSLMAQAQAQAQEGLAREDPLKKRFYAVLFSKGPGYVEEAGTRDQPGMQEHIEFIMGMHADAVIPLAGPLFDDDERKEVSGVLYFVLAGSVQEARDIALQEPMVKTQVVEIVSVREFITGVGVGRLD